MSYLDKLNQALTAASIPGTGSGANKGFWEHQLRDDHGKWMEMGRGSLFDIIKDGIKKTLHGIFIGPDLNNPGNGNFLVREKDGTKNVVSVPSHLVRQYKAGISSEELKRQGIETKQGGHIGDNIAPLETIQLNDKNVRPATAEDERMASIVPDKKQQKIIDEARANHPLANAPAGAEKGMDQIPTTPETKVEPASVDDAASKLWNDAAYGDGANLDDAIKAIQISAANGPAGFDVIDKEAKDLKKDDEVVDNKNKPVGRITDIRVQNGKYDFIITTPDRKTISYSAGPNDKIGTAVAKKTAAPATPKKAAKAKPVPAFKPATSKQVDELDNLADKISNDANIDPALKKSYDDIVSKLDNAEDVSSDEAKTVLDQVKAHYGQKTTPKAAPTIVAPKKAPAAAKATPKTSKKTASEIALAKKRMDDGSDITLNTNGKSEEDLRNLKLDPLMDENGQPLRDPNNPKKIIQDPNAGINGLLDNFPDAKVQGDNDRIILERRDYTDVDGKEYKFELGVSRTYGNQFIQHYKFTDKTTGEVKEFQAADYKDSFAGIFSKTNGILRMRDQLLGEDIPGKKLTRELSTYFGPNKNLDQRLKYYRKGSDLYGYRLVTPKENIKKFLDGTDPKYNMSMAQTGVGPNGEARYQFGNVMRGQVSPFWKSMEDKDWNGMKFRITQLLGRMPDSPESRKLLVDTLREETISHFKGVKKAKSYQTYANLLDKYMASNNVDLRDINRTPYIMGDGNTVAKVGDKVFYFPNHDEYSVGRIVGFQPASGKNGGYHDTASIQFADGTVINNLQTRNSFPAGPDSEFGDSDLTDYSANVKLDNKLALRKAMLGPALDAFNKKRESDKAAKEGRTAPSSANPPSAPDSTDNSDDVANPNAGAPYINSNGQQTNSNGQVISDDSTSPTPDAAAPDSAINTTDETGKDATPEAPKEGNVTKLQPNDSWYDENGDYKGVVVETQEVPAQDGGEPGLAVFYIDENGDEQVEIVEKSENRGPK
jgi:hypothetical protein